MPKNQGCINWAVSFWQTVIILEHEGLLILPHHRYEIPRVFQDLGCDTARLWIQHSSDSEWGMHLHTELPITAWWDKVLGSKALQFFPTIQE